MVRVIYYFLLAAGLVGALWLALPAPSKQQSLLGGAFHLQDQNGKAFTEKDLKGQYHLLYFGYATCPDVCPTDLYQMSRLAKMLEEDKTLPGELRPVFITVDPERDTVKHLESYMQAFHPTFIGLTGSVDAIRKAADAYKVFYKKVEQEDSALGYLMDHSAFMYLTGPDGQYITHYPHGMTAEVLKKDIVAIMKQ